MKKKIPEIHLNLKTKKVKVKVIKLKSSIIFEKPGELVDMTPNYIKKKAAKILKKELLEIYHGTARARGDIGDFIKKGDGGIITAYLPEDNIFAVFFGDKKWYTFHESEEWFLKHFKIIQEL